MREPTMSTSPTKTRGSTIVRSCAPRMTVLIGQLVQRGREDARAEHDVLSRGRLVRPMRTTADARHEEHADVRRGREDLAVVTGAARHLARRDAGDASGAPQHIAHT